MSRKRRRIKKNKKISHVGVWILYGLHRNCIILNSKLINNTHYRLKIPLATKVREIFLQSSAIKPLIKRGLIDSNGEIFRCTNRGTTVIYDRFEQHIE